MKNIPFDNFDCRLSKYPHKRSPQSDHSMTCSCYMCTVCNTSARWHKPRCLKWDKLITNFDCRLVKYPYTKQFTWSPKSDHSLTCSCYTICALYKHLQQDDIKPGVWGETNWLQRELSFLYLTTHHRIRLRGLLLFMERGGKHLGKWDGTIFSPPLGSSWLDLKDV